MDAESERGLNEQAKSPIKHGAKSPDKGEGKRNANTATEKRASGCEKMQYNNFRGKKTYNLSQINF